MNVRSVASFLAPWACVPILLLLNIEYRLYEFGSFDLRLLQIPAAMALTSRYGRNGFVAVLVGCAPLLVTNYVGPMLFGGWPSLYVIVAHAAWLTATNHWQGPNKSTSPHAAFMIGLLAAGSLALQFGNNPLAFDWWGTPLLYYAFFVLGLRDVQLRRWLNVAAFLTLFGVFLLLAASYKELVFGLELSSYVQLTDSLELRWALNRPGDFLTLLVFFWTGRWLGAMARSTAQPAADTLVHGVKLAAAASILFLAAPMWRGVVAAVAGGGFYENALRIISPAGSYYLLPMLALFLAISRRKGMLLSVFLVVTYYALSASAPGRSLYIDFADLAVVIAFAVLGARIAALIPAASAARAASWFPTPSPGEESSITRDEWKRQHDEISNTVRRVMLSLLAYALFCGLTLAASVDTSLFGGSMIKLPIANTSIDYTVFLLAGPLILLGLTVYLHLFLQGALDLGRPEGASPLPYIFNMKNPLAAALSTFLHYWLPVLLLFLFAWKAGNIWAGYWLGLASSGMGIVMVYLHMTRMSVIQGEKPHWFARTMFLSFGLLFVVQMAYGSALLKRPLQLDGQNLGEKLSKVRGVNFARASLNEANLDGAALRSVDFRDAKLRGATLNGADLRGADLRNADLTGAKLLETDLSGANFARAILSEASLDGAILRSVDFRGATLRGAKLNGADLRGADLRGVDLRSAEIHLADLEEADLRGVVGFDEPDDCNRLRLAKNWEQAYRDKTLSCDGELPEYRDKFR